MAQFNIGRDVSEELGNVYHLFVGARRAAESAAAKANEAQQEYTIQLTRILNQLGIPLEEINRVKIQWHTGIVTLEEVQIGMPSDGQIPNVQVMQV